MNPSSFLKAIGETWRKLDPFSLRVQLTVGIATVSGIGLGGVGIWTCWQMQQILIDTHRQGIEYIAERLPRDVELYSEMWPVETGLKKAIGNLTTAHTLLWVKLPNGTIMTESVALKTPTDRTMAALMSLTRMPLRAQVDEVNGRYFILSSQPLQVQGKPLGQLFVAQDISSDQTLFWAVLRSLVIASALSILTMTMAIAVYVERSLRPLRQLTATISGEDMGQAQLHLGEAPTEVRELARTCDTMLERLSAAWEQQRQFTNNVSHELRTSLTIVHGYLQSTLRRGTNLTTAQREALEIADAEANRTIRLLQDLLDLARADSGHLHLFIESLILNDVVAEVVGMAEQFSQRVILIQATAEPIQVRTDRNRLKQVLLNLIDNALQYSDDREPIAIKLSQMGEQVMLQVCDKGSGIALQHQARIFERFYRVDEARARSTGGYGLGLAIVKTLVEGMRGSVKVRSKLGEGSTFSVTLPTDSFFPHDGAALAQTEIRSDG